MLILFIPKTAYLYMIFCLHLFYSKKRTFIKFQSIRLHLNYFSNKLTLNCQGIARISYITHYPHQFLKNKHISIKYFHLPSFKNFVNFNCYFYPKNIYRYPNKEYLNLHLFLVLYVFFSNLYYEQFYHIFHKLFVHIANSIQFQIYFHQEIHIQNR